MKVYWYQFEGLKERLINYGLFIEKRLGELGELYNYGMVDDEEKAAITHCHSKSPPGE